MKTKKNAANLPVTLFVKNMVCDRCIRVVREELEKLDLEIQSIKLGEVSVATICPETKYETIQTVLHNNGFELINDKKKTIIEQIKTLLINLIHHTKDENEIPKNISKYIEKKIGYDYHYLSSLFSSIEGTTIEKYIILQKIERVKELLVYGELSLSEIAYQLQYSSVQHLSNQFKQITGLTPSYFKHVKEKKRQPIDKIL